MRLIISRRHLTTRLAPALALAVVSPSVVPTTVGATGRPARAGVVYTLTNDAQRNQVAIFRRATDGTLSPANPADTGGAGSGGGLGNQGALVLSRDGRWLLAVNAGSDEVSVFRVDVDGDALTLTDKVGSRGRQPVSVTIHRQLVYVLHAGQGNSIVGFRLSPAGRLTELPGSTRPLSGPNTAPAQVEFSPNGRLLVVTEKATNMISTYTVGADGLARGPNPQPSHGVTPFGFAFDQRRGRLLVSEAFGGQPDASAVSSYQVRHDGRLMLLDGSEPTTETAACWVVITPNHRYAYATNTGSGTITGFRLAPNGNLLRLAADGVSAGAAGRGPLDAAIDRQGRYLYVLNSGTDRLNAYRIFDDGALASIALENVGLPNGATGLVAR